MLMLILFLPDLLFRLHGAAGRRGLLNQQADIVILERFLQGIEGQASRGIVPQRSTQVATAISSSIIRAGR